MGFLRPTRLSVVADRGQRRGDPGRWLSGETRAMSRLACPEQPGVALHVVQRGLGRAACYSGERDRIAYLDALRGGAERCACAVHAYVLMGNHVHLLVTPAREGGATRLMRSIAESYGRYLAEAYGHEGALWEEPFDGSPVHARRYLLACMRYIEENPVRAGLAALSGARPESAPRRTGRSLFHLHAGPLHDLAPASDLVLDDRAELLRRSSRRLETVARKNLLHLLGLERLVGLPV